MSVMFPSAGKDVTHFKDIASVQENVAANLDFMENCATSALPYQVASTVTVTRALSATVTKAGMACFVQNLSAEKTVMPQEDIVNGQENVGVGWAGLERLAKNVKCYQDANMVPAPNHWSVDAMKAGLDCFARHLSVLKIAIKNVVTVGSLENADVR